MRTGYQTVEEIMTSYWKSLPVFARELFLAQPEEIDWVKSRSEKIVSHVLLCSANLMHALGDQFTPDIFHALNEKLVNLSNGAGINSRIALMRTTDMVSAFGPGLSFDDVSEVADFIQGMSSHKNAYIIFSDFLPDFLAQMPKGTTITADSVSQLRTVMHAVRGESADLKSIITIVKCCAAREIYAKDVLAVLADIVEDANGRASAALQSLAKITKAMGDQLTPETLPKLTARLVIAAHAPGERAAEEALLSLTFLAQKLGKYFAVDMLPEADGPGDIFRRDNDCYIPLKVLEEYIPAMIKALEKNGQMTADKTPQMIALMHSAHGEKEGLDGICDMLRQDAARNAITQNTLSLLTQTAKNANGHARTVLRTLADIRKATGDLLAAEALPGTASQLATTAQEAGYNKERVLRVVTLVAQAQGEEFNLAALPATEAYAATFIRDTGEPKEAAVKLLEQHIIKSHGNKFTADMLPSYAVALHAIADGAGSHASDVLTHTGAMCRAMCPKNTVLTPALLLNMGEKLTVFARANEVGGKYSDPLSRLQEFLVRKNAGSVRSASFDGLLAEARALLKEHVANGQSWSEQVRQEGLANPGGVRR